MKLGKIKGYEDRYKKPINAILETVSKVEETENDLETLYYMGNLRKYTTQFSRAIKMVAEHEKLSNNLYPHKRQCIDLVRFVREIARAAAPYAHQSGAAFTYRLPPEPIITITEIGPLTAILGQLLSNACRFKASNEVISIELYRRGETALILIWDRGPGIPEKAAPRVYEPYYSYDPNGAAFAGCGLGLTLANQFAQFLGGNLNFGPNGQGTFFVLTLPLRKRKRPRLSQPPIPIETFRLIMSDTLLKNKMPLPQQ